MTRKDVVKATVTIRNQADPFDQVTKGQCRKLLRFLNSVPAKREIGIDELEEAMNEKFTEMFTSQILRELE